MGGSWRMCILVLLFSVFVISVNGKKSASPGCRVRQFGKRLDCRGAGLRRIPRMNKGILIADFTDNLITHLAKEDLEHLRKLQQVYLNGNPLHCDCNLEWLRLGRKSLPVIQDVDNIQCKTPYHLRNKPLNSLSDLCSNGRIMHDRKNSLPDDEKNDIAENEDDSNKCSNNDDCPSGKVCTNNKCQCKDGYHAEEGGCEDVDECQRGSHMCSELTTICKNTVGSYTCKCSEGYKMGDKECIGQYVR
ncbi:fibrillin-3-like [Stylophora pistillata]|uniref:fibrillin-3-like n=1 Tax=Stylophora pistillata TaxID=50429 RepID=UPI000C0572CA|nr:fibrillin-3-like [Stylophora pistillata]